MRTVLRRACVFLLLSMSLIGVCWCSEGNRKSPFWSMVASAVVPGGGQFYCESYVRGAVFCSAQATLTAMTVYEHVLTEESLRRYKRSGDPEDYDDYAHHFERRKDLLWWDAGVLVLAVADAFVDAHMYGFGSKKGIKVSVAAERGVGLHMHLSF